MSRKYLPENVYSFTTTLSDGYLARVLEEVASDTDFVIVTEHHTLSGESEKATLAVRKTITSLGYFLGIMSLTPFLEISTNYLLTSARESTTLNIEE